LDRRIDVAEGETGPEAAFELRGDSGIGVYVAASLITPFRAGMVLTPFVSLLVLTAMFFEKARRSD
jgi:hypothetical protein